MEKCGNCRFYRRNFYKDGAGSLFGYCQAHPPAVVVVNFGDDIRPVTNWPSVFPEGWCGEYQPKEPRLNNAMRWCKHNASNEKSSTKVKSQGS